MKQECQCSKFKLEHRNVADFYQPCLAVVHPILHAFIRGVFATYSIILMSISIVHDHKSFRWLTFATSWNYLLVTIYFVYAFSVSIIALTRTRKVESCENVLNYERISKIPAFIKVFWITYTTTITMASFVMVVYWTILHDSELGFNIDSYLTVDRHGIQYILLLVEFLFHRIPFRFLHFPFPFAFAITYGIFNIVYWAVSGNLVYSVFDWEDKPGIAVALNFGMLLLVLVLHFMVYWLHMLKDKLISKSLVLNDADMSPSCSKEETKV